MFSRLLCGPHTPCCSETVVAETERQVSVEVPADAFKWGAFSSRSNDSIEIGQDSQSLAQPVLPQSDMKILCIERNSDCDSTAPTQRSSTLETRTLSILKTPGVSAIEVFPKKLDKAKLQEFRDCLGRNGIDTSSWGAHGSKVLEHLFWETYIQRGCLITDGLKPAGLKRVTRIVKIKIVADIFGVEHMLQSRLQFMHDGQCIERKQVLVKRLCWTAESVSVPGKPSQYDAKYAEESTPHCEDWRQGVKSALNDRLGVPIAVQEQYLEEEMHSYDYRVEDECESSAFPGLVTMYCIHEVTLRVINSEAPPMHCLGLPGGQEFATTEGDFNLTMQQMAGDEKGLPLGTQLNIWTWVRCFSPCRKSSRKSTTASLTEAPTKTTSLGDQSVVKRVPIPDDTARTMAKIQALIAKSTANQMPNNQLCIAQNRRQTNWKVAKRMARSITDPKYSLKEFTNDLQAFPELDLYLLEEENAETTGSASGRTLGDEFQRTVGAFYAIYWLMRMKDDGKDGFSFGVDAEWTPINHDDRDRMFPAEKRLQFFQECSWVNFEQLLIDAGMFEKKGNALKVNEERVLTLLSLTAIHDIMKVHALLPKVQPQHAPYHGYKAGDTIGDHDHALSYLMDHYPELLPSFHGLSKKEKFSVAFTQCQLQFNQGWFVQAEAPPGAIFTKFRELLIREHKSKVEPRDIALYFVHWLTDLAGAEPTPLGGCEKFVTKFPLPVLNSFLRSFGYVEKIALKTETEVMEEYLKMRWEEHSPSLGRFPTGDDAIAKMRLACMAQVSSMKILAGFEELVLDDKEILSAEMARTGCLGQLYSSDLTPADVQTNPMGPALLIYYGPAFLQSLGSDNAAKRLSVLAEVYRAARELWPLKLAQVAQCVTVRIDTIKGLSTSDIFETMKGGNAWVMVKHNEVEAFVEHSSTAKLNKFIAKGQAVHVLDLSTAMGLITRSPSC
mmetsp:Transcript_68025/g.106354  ORF Transcript_68025/g.106354 Transcript_68025/m.106354 type:complete len:951 (+) Transcript_68025:74-2926(+)